MGDVRGGMAAARGKGKVQSFSWPMAMGLGGSEGRGAYLATQRIAPQDSAGTGSPASSLASRAPSPRGTPNPRLLSLDAASQVGNQVQAKARLRAIGEGARYGRQEDSGCAPRRLGEEAPERVQWAKRNGDGSHGATESGRKHAGARTWVCELSWVAGIPRVRNPAKRPRRALGRGEGSRPAGRSWGEGGSVRQKPQR